VYLVHVVETPPSTLDVDFGSYKKRLVDAADLKLRELKAQLEIHAPHAVIDGRVSEGIRQEVVRRNADLIITGRGHAQATFNTMWSRLYPIIRRSPCPVLSI